VSQQTNSPALPTVEVTDPVNGGFDLYGLATDSERLYLSRENQGATVQPSLSAFAVPGLGGDYRLALQEALMPGSPAEGDSGNPPPTGGGLQVTVANGGGGGIAGAPDPGPISSTSPCGHQVGSNWQLLLAAAKCTALQTYLEAKCAVHIALLVGVPAKSLKAAEGANGLYKLSKIKKRYRPLVKWFNTIKGYKFSSKAPAGFKTGGQVISKIRDAKSASDFVKLLPFIHQALSAADYAALGRDVINLLGLQSCADAIATAFA
jgi:hypothetical protein